eukprot:350411-Chlamydomonas_euryale.AAC.4
MAQLYRGTRSGNADHQRTICRYDGMCFWEQIDPPGKPTKMTRLPCIAASMACACPVTWRICCGLHACGGGRIRQCTSERHGRRPTCSLPSPPRPVARPRSRAHL